MRTGAARQASPRGGGPSRPRGGAAPPVPAGRSPLESRIAAGAVAAAGCGTAIAGAGWAAGDPLVGLAGGILLLAGLGVLLAAHWLPGLPILALVLVLPAPIATDSLRVSIAAAVTAVIVLAWCLRRGVDGAPLRLGPFPHRATAALLAAVVLAAAFAESTVPAARELVTFVLLVGLLVAATDELASDRRLPARLARLLAGVAAVAGPLAALEALGVIPGRFPLPGTGFHRATLGLGWPNELAMFFALTLPLGVYAARTARGPAGRILGWFAVAAVGLGLLATFSRGSWLALPAGAGALLLAGQGRLAVRIWVLALVGALAVDLASGGAVTGRLGSLPGDWVVEQRAALLLTGVLMFLAHPVVGIGPGGFDAHLERFGPRVDWLWDYVGSPHNAFVQMAAETGVVGLAAFVAFIGATFLVLLRSARRARRSEADREAVAGGGVEAEGAGRDGAADRDERELRLALLWCFGVVVALAFLEWFLAHGVGQLVVLVAAMGFALDAGREVS